MPITKRGGGSWTWATVDTVLSVLALGVVWHPAVSYANALTGTPFGEEVVVFAVGVLAVGTAYPFVAGDWSLGDLGEYLFLLYVAAVIWSVVGMGVILASGIRFSGTSAIPQATVWALAYVSVYVLVFRTNVTIFR